MEAILGVRSSVASWLKSAALGHPLVAPHHARIAALVGSPWHYWIALALALAALRALLRLFFAPYVHTKFLTEDEQRRYANPIVRNVTELPPPYPNGWFRLLHSHELPRGAATSLHALGHRFLLFRGEDGGVRILHPYCPHLGADIGQGGKVDGNCVTCPFHAWKFDGTGKCVSIPYSPSEIPDRAQLRRWECREIGNMILVWHDAEKRPPLWEPPHLDATPAGRRFVYHGHTEHHVACHVQEIPENGPDSAHLDVVHNVFLLECVTPMGHKWRASWRAGADDSDRHLSYIQVDEDIHLLGRSIPGMSVSVPIRQIGPGLVQLVFTILGYKVCLNQSVTPVEPLLQRVGHVVTAEPGTPRIIPKFVLWSVHVMFERDLVLWNNKKYWPSPLAVKGDGPLLAFRRWYRSFYSEHSVTAQQAFRGETALDW